MFGIRVERHGGPEVLEWGAIEDPTPGPHDLVVDVAFAGLNFLDCYQRTGLYPMELPFVPGSEGAGVVRDVGAEVSSFAAGDQVAWSSVLGSYVEQVRVPEASAVAVPDEVGLDVAAAVMLQGMTAHYLALDSFPLAGKHRCLIHAGAGGTGQLLIQIAKRCGVEVFTTVGSDEKVGLAREAGADHVIRYDEEDFGAAVERIAGVRPLDVVYDGVGQAVFSRSLELLRRRGTMVTFGNASGAVEPLSPLVLTRNGSLYLTRPTLVDYIANARGPRAPIGRPVHLDRRRVVARADRRRAFAGAGGGSAPDAGGPGHHGQDAPSGVITPWRGRSGEGTATKIPGMKVGDVAERTRRVEAEDIERFTAMTGDRNPLHYDVDAATSSRFGGIIVQGGVTTGLLNAVGRRRPAGTRQRLSERELGLPRAARVPAT